MQKGLLYSMIGCAAVASILWMTVFWNDSRQHLTLYLFCAGGVLLERLQPFEFMSPAHEFQWIPFDGLILAPPEACIPSVLRDAFSLGILIWLLLRAGIERRKAILTGTVAVAAVLAARCFIPDKPSEISDLIVLLGLAWMMVLTGEEAILLRRQQRW
jgi:hypothetical protein